MMNAVNKNSHIITTIKTVTIKLTVSKFAKMFIEQYARHIQIDCVPWVLYKVKKSLAFIMYKLRG